MDVLKPRIIEIRASQDALRVELFATRILELSCIVEGSKKLF
jgi:hypothetical protein